MTQEAFEPSRERTRSLESKARSCLSNAGANNASSGAAALARMLGSQDPLVRNVAAFTLKSSPEILEEQFRAAEESADRTALVGVLLGYYHAGVADHAAQIRIRNCLDHPSSEVADWGEWVLARVGLPPECLRVAEVVRQPRILSILSRMGPHARLGVPLVAEVARSVPSLLAPALDALSQMGIDADLTLDLLARIPLHEVAIQFDAIRLVTNVLAGQRTRAQPPPRAEQMEEMVSFVAERLSHENEWVRYRAVLVFCDFRPFVPGQAEQLPGLLSDANAAVRWRTCDALSSAQPGPEASAAVAHLLRSDPDPDVGLAAARLTSVFPEPADHWRTELDELLNSESFMHQLRGILVAGWAGGAGTCLERLLTFTTAPAAELRGWVAWAIARLPGLEEQRLRALGHLWRDACWQVRTTALQALAEHFPLTEAVQSILFNALTDRDEQVRETACKLLSRAPLSALKPTPEILDLLAGPLPPLLGPSRGVLDTIRQSHGLGTSPA
jgi:HEAT repeat protein